LHAGVLCGIIQFDCILRLSVYSLDSFSKMQETFICVDAYFLSGVLLTNFKNLLCKGLFRLL